MTDVSKMKTYQQFVFNLSVQGNCSIGNLIVQSQDICQLEKIEPEFAKLYQQYASLPLLSKEMNEIKELIIKCHAENKPTFTDKLFKIGERIEIIAELYPYLQMAIKPIMLWISAKCGQVLNGLSNIG